MVDMRSAPATANARKPFNLPYATVAETPSTQVVAGRVNAMINAAEALIRAAEHWSSVNKIAPPRHP